MKRSCSLVGCDRPRAGHGYCDTHYKRWRRNGDPGPVKIAPKAQPGRLCDIEGCRKPHYGHGWCLMHYARWRKYGDPMSFQYERQGPNGPIKGIPGYVSMHKRLSKVKTGRCSIPDCTRTNTQMALIHGCGHLIATPGLYTLLYSDRLADYLELCAQCHNAYDRGSFRLLGDAGLGLAAHLE